MGIQKIIVECAHRLVDGVLAELADNGIRNEDILGMQEDELLVRTRDPDSLQQTLQCPGALHDYFYFPISRPKALLGHQHLTLLCKHLTQLCQKLPEADSIRLEAAGKSSSVMKRISHELQTNVFPPSTVENHPLLIRVRPSRYHHDGWEVLIRRSLLPLSVRSWRLHDIKGALNGSLSASIIRLLPPPTSRPFLDPMCGSGTFLIEYKKRFPEGVCIGSDRSEKMISASLDHLNAANCTVSSLIQADARSLPFPDNSIHTLVCNPPWGERISLDKDDHFHNELLQEFERILEPGGVCFCLSQRKEVLEKQLSSSSLRISRRYELSQRGFTPTLFKLKRI